MVTGPWATTEHLGTSVLSFDKGPGDINREWTAAGRGGGFHVISRAQMASGLRGGCGEG